MNRTVEIIVPEEIREAFADKWRDPQFQAAIGDLSMWGMGGKANKVRIFLEEGIRFPAFHYMEAIYTSIDDGLNVKQEYVRGALFRDGKWEFHS